MHQCGGLEGLAGSLAIHLRAREAAQFFIDEGQQLGRALGLAVGVKLQQLRDLAPSFRTVVNVIVWHRYNVPRFSRASTRRARRNAGLLSGGGTLMDSEYVRAWKASAKVTQTLLKAIPADCLEDRYSKRTRTVAAQFAHIHYVRVRNLDVRGGRDLLDSVTTFEKGAQPGKRELQSALKESDAAMQELVARFVEAGAVKSWKGTLATYIGYHSAHEAHHRALAIVSLRLSGHKIPEEAKYSIWDTWRKG